MSGNDQLALYAACVGVIMALMFSLACFRDIACPRSAKTVSWGLLTVTPVIMISTANRWAPTVVLFFFGRAIIRAISTFFLPLDPHANGYLSRTQIAEFLVYSILVVALTFRFLRNRPAPTMPLDRLALTAFVLVTLEQLISQSRFSSAPSLIAIGALAVAWGTQRFTHRKPRPKASSS